MRKMLLVMVAVLALVGAACSSGNDSGGTTGTTGGTTGSTGSTGSESGCTEANAVDLSGDDPFTVTIQNFAFDPPCFKAASASAITIVNKDDTAHTLTMDGTQATLDDLTGPAQFSPVDRDVDGGQTFNGQFGNLAPGSYDFHCKIHSTMTGTVIFV